MDLFSRERAERRFVYQSWEANMTQSTFQISLTEAEVVVLNSCIEKLVSHADKSGLFDAAERQAFWNFQCLLEEKDRAAFAHDYDLRLREMKKTLLPDETA